MTYTTGGNIQAADYNAFSTLSTGMNEIFADSNSGATTLPLAGFGYGQTALTVVSALANVNASEWNSLFTTMRSSAIHQGTSGISPPVPVSGPVAGANIVAVTSEATMLALISTLKTNKFVLAPGQSSVIAGTPNVNPASWSTSLSYTFQVDFGSTPGNPDGWNNARYFFNSGGSVSITGVYSYNLTPDELAWQNLFLNDFPVNMNWQTTTQPAGNLIVNQAGFYQDPSNPVLYPGLDPTAVSWSTIYQKYAGGGIGPYYATNYATVEAKLTNAAGTNGKIDFRVSLIDGDTAPVLKAAGRMTYTINRIQSSGAIAYPGGYTFT
jgi:hypothetical protein